LAGSRSRREAFFGLLAGHGQQAAEEPSAAAVSAAFFFVLWREA